MDCKGNAIFAITKYFALYFEIILIIFYTSMPNAENIK